jgi:hypothetical protein
VDVRLLVPVLLRVWLAVRLAVLVTLELAVSEGVEVSEAEAETEAVLVTDEVGVTEAVGVLVAASGWGRVRNNTVDKLAKSCGKGQRAKYAKDGLLETSETLSNLLRPPRGD